MTRPLALLILAALLACLTLPHAFAQASERPDGWRDESHGKRAPLNARRV